MYKFKRYQLSLPKALKDFPSWISQHMAVRHSDFYSGQTLIHNILRHLILFHFALPRSVAKLRPFHLLFHILHAFP